MKNKAVIIVFAFLLVFALGFLALAEVNNQNLNEQVNTNTEYSQFTECIEECDGEQIQQRIQKRVFRSQQLEEGERGEKRQQQRRMGASRF